MDFLRRGELVNKGPSVSVGSLKVPQNPVSRSQVALKLHLKRLLEGGRLEGLEGWEVGGNPPFFFLCEFVR